jgi:hypothetical protein
LEPRSANPDVKQKKSAGMKHPSVEFINAVTTNTNSQALEETKSKIEEMELAIKINRKLLRDLVQHMQGVQESLFQKEQFSSIQ